MDTTTTPRIEIQPNKLANGRKDPRHPFKAVVAENVIALGENTTDARARAMRALCDAWYCQQQFPVIRFAADDSVFVARETAPGIAEYSRYQRYPDGSPRSCGSASGKMNGYYNGEERVFVRLESYLDYVVQRYNEAVG